MTDTNIGNQQGTRQGTHIFAFAGYGRKTMLHNWCGAGIVCTARALMYQLGIELLAIDEVN